MYAGAVDRVGFEYEILIVVKHSPETHNFEVFIQHMSEVVTVVPRRLLRCVSVILDYHHDE